MWLTYVLYVFVFLILILLTSIANKKRSLFVFLQGAVILALLAGFRDKSVGIDSESYVNIFNLISSNRWGLIYGLENTFISICAFLLKLNNSYTFLFVVFAFITNILFFYRFWDFKEDVSLCVVVAIYYISFYFLSYNIMRQMIAVSIVFYFSRFIRKRHYFIFIVGVLLACLFHKSAILAIILLLLEVPQWNRLNKSQKIILILTFLFSPLIIPYVIEAYNKYSHYFNDINWNIGFMTIIKIVLFLYTSFIVKKKIAIESNDRGAVKSEMYTFSSICNYYFIGLIFSSLGYVFNFMDRLGLYFVCYETIYMGYICRRLKRAPVQIYLLLFTYIFVVGLISGGQGQNPYIFIW